MNYGLPPSVIKTEAWLMRRTELSLGTRLTYFALKGFYDYTAQHARVTQRQLAESLGLTDRSIRASIVQLRRVGLIQWTRNPTGKLGNCYVFLQHPWQQLTPPHDERTALTGGLARGAAVRV